MKKSLVWTAALTLISAFALISPVKAHSEAAPVMDIAAKATEVRPILVGSLVPDVTVRDINGKAVRLREVVGKKPTVLIFYRGGWCPFCNLQMGQLQAIEPQLEHEGYQVLAISPDRPEELKKSLDKHKLTYTLLTDSPMTAARAFGIAFRVDDTTLMRYKGFGIDLEAASGEKHHLLPVPSVFVISTDGMVQFSYVNPNYKVRLAPEVLLAAAQAALPAAK